MRDAFGRVQSTLVLGGGSEIGLAITRRLVERGCRTVLLAGRSPAALETAAARLRATGASTVETIAFDALDTPSHVAVVADAFGRAGDVDLVLLAFGVLGEQSAFDRDPEAAATSVRTNYVGAVSSLLAVAERMVAQGHGTIVVLSSVAGERVRRANFVYGSSKAGLDGFAQGLGDALSSAGVRVLVVRPGFVRSRMTEGMEPAPMSTTPDAVADAVIGALARNADVVWVPSQLRWVMMVLRHLPRSVWRRISNR